MKICQACKELIIVIFYFFMVACWPAYLSNSSDESVHPALHVYFASRTHKNKDEAVLTEERGGWGSCGYTQIARIQNGSNSNSFLVDQVGERGSI